MLADPWQAHGPSECQASLIPGAGGLHATLLFSYAKGLRVKFHRHDSIWYSALAAQVPLASATTHPPCPRAGSLSLPCVAAASWAGCLPACREATGSPEGWNSHSRRRRPQSLNPLAGTGQSICLGRSPLASPQRILPDSDQPPQPPSRADEGRQ